MNSIQKAIDNNDDKCKITKEDVDKSFTNFKPSLTNKDVKFYDDLKRKLLNLDDKISSSYNEEMVIGMNRESDINKMKTTLY